MGFPGVIPSVALGDVAGRPSDVIPRGVSVPSLRILREMWLGVVAWGLGLFPLRVNEVRRGRKSNELCLNHDLWQNFLELQLYCRFNGL